MDANALQVIMACSKALWQRDSFIADQLAATCIADQLNKTGNGTEREGRRVGTSCEPATSYCQSCALTTAAALQEEAQCDAKQEADIWADHPTMQFLKTGDLPAPLDQQRRRVQRRARSYRMLGDKLMRRMPDGTERLVPSPEQRAQLIL